MKKIAVRKKHLYGIAHPLFGFLPIASQVDEQTLLLSPTFLKRHCSFWAMFGKCCHDNLIA